MGALSRRRFLNRMGRASACVACAAILPLGLGGCASVHWAPFERSGGRLTLPLSAFDGTSGVLLDVPDRPAPIYVHRGGVGQVTAVLTLCTHQGCTAAPQGPRIVCPCHGSEYAPDGAVLQGPAERNLLRYPAGVTDGFVWIDLNGGEDV